MIRYHKHTFIQTHGSTERGLIIEKDIHFSITETDNIDYETKIFV